MMVVDDENDNDANDDKIMAHLRKERKQFYSLTNDFVLTFYAENSASFSIKFFRKKAAG